MEQHHINWGIIGCGDVTEVKSGPAFSKVVDSSLVAVMRRDVAKAKDYAERHRVPKWYDDANALINDPEVNAIYIATPPSSHEAYTIAALKAGKPVYVEKPMTTDVAAAQRMVDAVKQYKGRLCVAHYRRAQPLFKKIKQLIDEKIIGDTRFVKLDLYKKLLSAEQLAMPGQAWRVDPAISGGGLFYDLAPHQLDLMYYFFGSPGKISGFSINQSGLYNADDITTGTILFRNGRLFSGSWCFNAAAEAEKDSCEIIGSAGKITFSVFQHEPVILTTAAGVEKFEFEPLQHVQQPMIGSVVEYFLDKAPNPCSVEEGLAVMQMIAGFK